MHKKLIMALCWLIIGKIAIAQTSEDSLIIPPKEWFIKLAPLALLETDGGINFSGEYVLPKYKIGLQLEVQPVLLSIYNTRGGEGFDVPESIQASGMPLGIKLRPEVRYYFEGLRSRPYHPHIVRAIDGTPLYAKMKARTYVAVDILFKQTWTQRRGELPVNNGGTQPAYRQTADYTDVKQVVGGDIKLGNVFSISQKNNWWLELYIGIGLRNKRFWYRRLPVGASNPARSTVGFPHAGIDDTGIAQQHVPSLPAGLKLTCRL